MYKNGFTMRQENETEHDYQRGITAACCSTKTCYVNFKISSCIDVFVYSAKRNRLMFW